MHRLTGECVLDHPAAGMCEPLYNVKEHTWIKDWADEVAPGLMMPELRWPHEVAGEVTEEAAEGDGTTGQHPRRRGDHQRLVGGGEHRGAQARRPHG